MAKRPADGKCVHCLADPVRRNWDHVFPESWYPDALPENIEKWQIPSCTPCNSTYGRIEDDFRSRIKQVEILIDQLPRTLATHSIICSASGGRF